MYSNPLNTIKPTSPLSGYPDLYCFYGYPSGFNGQERDDELAGVGNFNTALYWEYDTRLGRRWNVDPKFYTRPELSPFSALKGNPVFNIDPNGDEEGWYEDENGGAKFNPKVNSQKDIEDNGLCGNYIGSTIQGHLPSGNGFSGDVNGNISVSMKGVDIIAPDPRNDTPGWAKSVIDHYQSSIFFTKGDNSTDYGPFNPTGMGLQVTGSIGGYFAKSSISASLYIDNWGFRAYSNLGTGGGLHDAGFGLSGSIFTADYYGGSFPDPLTLSGTSVSNNIDVGFLNFGNSYSTKLTQPLLRSSSGYIFNSVGVNLSSGFGYDKGINYTPQESIIGIDFYKRK